MPRSTDSRKLALWQERFERFWGGGLAVEPFCAREQVSVAAFYYWREKVGELRRPSQARPDGRCAQLNSTQLAMLLGGVSLAGARQRKRYRHAS